MEDQERVVRLKKYDVCAFCGQSRSRIDDAEEMLTVIKDIAVKRGLADVHYAVMMYETKWKEEKKYL